MDPQLQIKIASGVCSSVAFATTAQRIFIRLRGRGLWFDDAWALFSALSLITQLVAVFLRVPNPPGKVGAIRYYLLGSSFYCVIWSARLSILFSLIRIERDGRWTRAWRLAGVAFVVAWMVLLGQMFWECGHQVGWESRPEPQCKLGKDVAILQLVTDVLSDGCLIFIPIRMLRVLSNRNLRNRLMLIFSTCIVTTIVSLVHVSFILASGGPRQILAGLTEDALSLVVCNLPLCAAYVMKRAKWFEEDDRTGSNGNSHNDNNGNNNTFRPIWLKRASSASPGTSNAQLEQGTAINLTVLESEVGSTITPPPSSSSHHPPFRAPREFEYGEEPSSHSAKVAPSTSDEFVGMTDDGKLNLQG